MKINLNKKIILPFLLLSCLLIFGVTGYVRSDEISNISCSANGTSGYAACGSTGSGSKNVTWPAIPSAGPGRVDTTITLGGLSSPYLQPYYIKLEVGGHTNCWYGYANDYPPTSGWPNCNTDQSNHNSGGDLNWMMCLEGYPGGPSDLCWSSSQNYPSNLPGQDISLDEERSLSNTDYANYVGLMANVVYDNNSQELGDTDYVNLSSSYRLASIESFSAPFAVAVGTPFAVNWSTEWSTVANYPRLNISGPLTCNQTGYVPNQSGIFPTVNGSTQCTGTGVGTAQLEICAAGPAADNSEPAMVCGTHWYTGLPYCYYSPNPEPVPGPETMCMEIDVDITASGSPPPPPGAGACALTPSPAMGVFPLNNVDATVSVNPASSDAHEIKIDCTNDGTFEDFNYIQLPYTFVDRCNYSGPATMLAYARNLATSQESTCTATISAPTITNNVTISSPTIKPDGATPYSITVTGNDTSGGTNITHLYALINNQGGNAGQFRGYITWYYGNPSWPGQQSCGEGYAAVQPGYGDQHINLVSCTASGSGNTQTVVFNVTFNPSFTTPTTNNDISGYAHDGPTGINTSWVNHDLNFGLQFAPVDGAEYISQSVPASVTVGQTFSVIIAMKNDGTTIWDSAANYRIGVKDPPTGDEGVWGPWWDYITSDVAIGATKVFTFDLTAPNNVLAQPGCTITSGVKSCNFQWQMVHDAANTLYTPNIPPTWFGDLTPFTSIIVNPAAAPTVSNITIDSPIVIADGVTSYNIVETSTYANGGENIGTQYAIINLQGANGGQHRGFLAWDYAYNWSGEKDAQACSGGGYATIRTAGWTATYGNQYLELISCSSSIFGNNRTVTYTVAFNPNFLTDGPATDNDISGYVWAVGESAWINPWVNFETNFGLAAAPTVTTLPRSNLTQTSVTLNGEGDPNGSATTGWFRYSTTNPGTCNNTFGTRDPASGGSSLGSGSSNVAYSTNASPLSSNTTYYFCAIASNAGGTAWGTPLSFTTASSFSYNLSNSGTTNVAKGSSDVFIANTITKTLISGSTLPVTLSVPGLPSGVSVYSISSPQDCSPNCQSIVTFKVSPTTAPNTYSVSVSGNPASANGPTTFNLVVSGNPMSVICSANPTTASIGQNVTWTATVTGGTGPYTYVWDFDPPPSTTSAGPTSSTINNQTRTYSTIGQKTAEVEVTDVDYPSSASAICSPAATTQINFSPGFEEF